MTWELAFELWFAVAIVTLVWAFIVILIKS